MMKMGIEQGNFTITDDNRTIVSRDVAEQIEADARQAEIEDGKDGKRSFQYEISD